MLYYYNQLFEDPEGERDVIAQDLRAIEDYLSNAIEALKKKQAICANWRKLNAPRLILKLQGSLYKVPKQEIVISEALQDYQAGEYIDSRGERYLITRKVDDNAAIFDKRYTGKPLFPKDDKPGCEGRIEHNRPNNVEVVGEDSSYYIVHIPEGQPYENSDAQVLANDETKDLLSKISHLSYDGNSYRVKVDSESCVQSDVSLDDLRGKTLMSEEPYRFELMLVAQRPKGMDDGCWIELIEVGDEENEDETLSPLRFFFDDDISIKDDKGNDYLIKQARPEDFQLRLQRQGERYDCYPPEGAILNVRVNTYQLQMQREAVRLLRERPTKEQLPLLQLFRNKYDVIWDDYQALHPEKWLVLTDENRPGYEEQQNFVAKALGTPDYAFLAGPPGSGKTTVIIELIAQIIARGQRVLLCGSTHVAIDNVLERLDEGGLIERLGIAALRVGDQSRISEKVKKFQIDEVLEHCPERMRHLVRASANLVCGTTMGILQHPDFKRDRNDLSPVTPDFDYLIIDESSKTTFQEFLVPALHARHWVLVGDVMQLSPYTERELVEANIRQLSIKKTSLSPPHQQAIYLLHQLESLFKIGGKETLCGCYVIPVSKEVLLKLREEYSAGRGRDTFNNEYLAMIFVDSSNYSQYSRLQLSAYELVFVERHLVNRNIIPETHAILWDKRPEGWERSEHSFAFRALAEKIKSGFRLKGRGSREVNVSQNQEHLEQFCRNVSHKLYARSWAGEVAWRIDREHQTRLQNKSSKGKSYAEQIGDLMPIENRGLWISAINRIASIAYPSILEALELGIISLSKKEVERGDRRSTLVEGFDRRALGKRREVLTYQHRMHPELSLFPRQRFYYARQNQAEALCDNPTLNRIWNYKRYPRRNWWKEVEGTTVRGKNDREAMVIMEELEHFVQYAQSNPPVDDPDRHWEVALLTFYRGQERNLRDLLRKKTNSQSSTHFEYKGLEIVLCTVDRFQGQEADIVFLSMVQTQRVGFMDSPNRLNVSLTRARYQNIIVGHRSYFLQQTISDDLRVLAENPSESNWRESDREQESIQIRSSKRFSRQ